MSDSLDVFFNLLNKANQRANATDWLSRPAGEYDFYVENWEKENPETARVFREQHRISTDPIDRYIERERQNGR